MDDHFERLAGSELTVSPPPEPDHAEPSAPLEQTPIRRQKSPPLAFTKTSNDSLHPFTPHQLPISSASSSAAAAAAAAAAALIADMGGFSSPNGGNVELRRVIDRQADAIKKLHDAFAAEREAWAAERESQKLRIAQLEQLLKTRNHHSPAKSPVLSPDVNSPPTKPAAPAHRLPSIAEDENIPPLSQRRENAPRSIEIPSRRGSSEPTVAFAVGETASTVEELPIPAPAITFPVSPVPPLNRAMAGHTPLRLSRPPTPPPVDMAKFGIEDTPTRNNTHINALLTRSNDEDEDRELSGPLNMPELPHQPDATNFTLDALSKRLEQVANDPNESRPTVFATPSPGLASPAEAQSNISDVLDRAARGVHEPPATRTDELSASDLSSTARSPPYLSPDGGPLSQHESQEIKMHHDFENGGIKLKKKPSINFGQPLGSLNGFSTWR